MRKPARVKVGDVWTAHGLGRYRTVLRIDEHAETCMKDGTVDGQYAKAIVVRYVTYSTPHGHVMRCTLRTFRRWIYSHEAARAQKTRRRELKLSRH